MIDPGRSRPELVGMDGGQQAVDTVADHRESGTEQEPVAIHSSVALVGKRAEPDEWAAAAGR